MLLIIEALLLISAALVKDHRAAADDGPLPLNIQDKSVDDDFKGCENEMVNLVVTQYLQNDIETNSRFKEAWQNDAAENMQQASGSKQKASGSKQNAAGSKQNAAGSNQQASGSNQNASGSKQNAAESKQNAAGSNQQASGSKQQAAEIELTKHELKAIRIWTGKNMNIYGDFKEAIRTGKQNYKDETYEWYALHFFLTRAIQKLKTECVTTYRRTKSTYVKENVINTEIRFGSFASSSFDKQVTSGFGDKSCFEIYTCFGADLTSYSLHPKMKEVLIPPYETFKVKEIKEKKNDNNLWCDTVYKLESFQVRSDLRCAIVNKINSE